METNGPIRDFQKYAQVSTLPLLRPLGPTEIGDAAIYIYRSNFNKLIPLCMTPSLFVSSVIIVFFQLLTPIFFAKSESNDLLGQVLQSAILLFGGVTLSLIVALIGLSKIASLSHALVQTALRDETITQAELDRRAKPFAAQAFSLLLRASGFSLGIVMISLIPMLLSGILGAVTSDQSAVSAIVLFISLFAIPIGIIIALSRFSVALGTMSVGLSENLKPKGALERAKYLFSSKSRPMPKANPAANGLVMGGILYLFLRAGYSSVLSGLGLDVQLVEMMPTPLLRIFIENILRILPEFLAILFLLPYTTVAGALYYYQRRIVVEGLDIVTLYESLAPNRR